MNRNVTATILIILALGLYFTLTKGILTQANTIKAVNDQYVSAITSAEQLIKVRDQVLTDYNNLSPDDRARLDKMIPDTVDNIRLIIDLNSVALKHGFSLRNITAAASASTGAANSPSTNAGQPGPSTGGFSTGSTGTTIPVPSLDTVTISFGVTAPYEDFISFLQDLEANLRIMDVTHLTVAANDTGTYDFSLQLKTYWLRQ